MSGVLDRFIASIRSFVAGPEKMDILEVVDPLHRIRDIEKLDEKESDEITLAEGAGFVVKEEVEV
jgi:hypothetical protein